MSTTSSLRIDDDLYAAAKLVGATASRSASQQVAHWANLGRELEASRHISARAIADVLAGRSSYDDLPARDQAVVRATWTERIDSATESLDLESAFLDEGRTFVELDSEGVVTRRGITSDDSSQ